MRKVKYTTVLCKEIKIIDFMFKKFIGSYIKPGSIYRAHVNEDGDTHLVLRIDGRDVYVYISDLNTKIKDPRFIGTFEDVTVASFLDGLPDIPEIDLIDDWLDGKIVEEEEESEEDYFSEIPEEEQEDSVGYIEVTGESALEIEALLNSYLGIKNISERLSGGILEALRGVEMVSPGHLIEEDRTKLLEALKTVISNFDRSKDLNELLMAQYLLFNIIILAKNNWSKD